MYPPNTILTRTAPLTIEQQNPEPGGEPIQAADPLNTVKVVGPSPIKTPTRAEWASSGGDAVIVAPVNDFGANAVMPGEYLQANYEVSHWGDEAEGQKIILDPQSRASMVHAETPEQAFTRIAREEQAKGIALKQAKEEHVEDLAKLAAEADAALSTETASTPKSKRGSNA